MLSRLFGEIIKKELYEVAMDEIGEDQSGSQVIEH